MPQIGFKKELAPKVESGAKPFTLRAFRADGRDPKAGQMLYMFTGLRTKQCRRIGEKLCRFAVAVKLHSGKIEIPGLKTLSYQGDLDTFARLDGFADWNECRKFHQLNAGDIKTMWLIAWVTRDELKELIGL